MTSQELVVQSTAYSRANLTERQQYVAMLARAGDLLPEKLRGGMTRDPNTGMMVQQGNIGKTFLLAETGDMLGIHPMAALTGVHIIEGKPSISANLMGGLVRKAGHKLRVKLSGSVESRDLAARAVLIREDDPDFEFEVIWTLAKAERAGLFPGKANSNWAKYPEAMLKARAIAEIVREGAPDVLMGGNVYTAEELGAQVDEQGEPVEMTQVRDEPQMSPAPQQRAEAPVMTEEPKGEPEASEDVPPPFDWMAAVANLASRDEAKALYQRARAEGALDTEVKQGRKKRKLGDVLVEVGQALADAEKAAAEAGQEDVVVAEVVEDDQPMAMGGE